MPRRRHLIFLVLFSFGLLATRSARAASLQKVAQSEWGSTGFPSYVNMYLYVPDTLGAKPPIVVAPHHCQGSAQSTYSEMASLRAVADKTGFVMVIPEATGQNCWDAGSERSLRHGGKGDTGAIVQMVKYALGKYNGDPSRVYSVGGSSGGIMTEALLGVYPDVFMAGISLMGVPCGCWASGYNDVTGSGGTAQWSSCAGGTVTKTAQQWGDLVRSYFPGYQGHRPRLQHWHGSADTTIDYKNMAEDIKEWTNLLGLSPSPTATDMPKSGTTHQSWKSACGDVYETFSLAGVGHSVPFDGNAVAAYFGIDKAGGQDPETMACPGAVPGGTGAGGASGGATGGGSGAGGGAGVGGRAGGASGAGGGRVAGTSGATGGANAGGRAGDDGQSRTGGSSAATGGVSGTGGSAASTGGKAAGGASAATGGRASTGGDTGAGPGGDDGNTGCSCAASVDSAGRDAAMAALMIFAAFTVFWARAKRSSRR